MTSNWFKNRQRKKLPSEQAKVLYDEALFIICKSTDRMFALLLSLEWIAGILCSIIVSPKAWSGTQSNVHIHVYAAVFLGAVIVSFPIFLALFHPGKIYTRHIIGAAQMLMAALFIHLLGGRIEAHFLIFGSLAFLAFYRDWPVLLSASLIIVTDHLFRGLYWPQSIFGFANTDSWRWLEHGVWVLFEDIFLIYSCIQGKMELRAVATKQADLAQAKDRLEESQALAHLGSFELDTATNKLNWSSELFKIFGISSHEFHGTFKAFLQFVHPEDRTVIIENHKKAMQTKQPFHMQTRIIRKDGLTRICESNITVLVNEENKPVRIVGTVQDITERLESEQIIRSQQAQIVASSKLSSLGEMAGSIAHEINTPLGAITLSNRYLETILKKDVLDKAAAFKLIDSIAKTCERISKTVGSLRSFARDGSKDPISEIKVQQLIDDTLGLCSERFKNRGVKLEVINHLDQNQTIGCRSTELVQVFVNLLNNAIDAIDAIDDKWVKIELSDQDLGIRFIFTDSGPGIPIEVRRKIFEPFFTTKGAGIGTGLGLSISKDIIESHHGKMSIDDTCVNTRFVLWLPKEHQLEKKVS